MKKLISLTVSAAILLSPFAYTINVPALNLKVDAVSAASEDAVTEAKPTAKPAATAKPVATPKATAKPVATPKATAKPVATPKATAKPAATPKASTAPAATPKATTEPAAKPVATAKPATVKENVYQNGVYVAYGDAYSKGTEGAKIEIKNGKIISIDLMRTNPKLIDRDARNNYSSLWQAYGTMKDRLLGKNRNGAAAVDTVSGATRSSNGWKLSVDRAFERALKDKDADAVYFDGVHMGIDPESKYAVFATYESNKLTAVKVYPLNSTGDFVDEKVYTAEQVAAIAAITPELLAKGTEAQPVEGLKAEFRAATNAFWDAEQNASINNTSAYVDGFYSSYGTARSVGVEKADIVIRNGKLVDVKLFRLGNNLMDRGETAYASVVKANAPMTAKLLANGSYIANYNEEIDGISGATESSHSWNLAVERAFEKALKVPTAGEYFDGKFAGVDNQSKVMLLVDIVTDEVTNVKVSLFSAEKKLIADDKLTPEQKTLVDALTTGLKEKGVQLANVEGQEELSGAARAALEDALSNASKVQGAYKDGTFTAFGDAYDKGTNRADVTLRNGKIVNVALFRVGMNLVDRGEAAYPAVVTAIPQLTASILEAGTREAVQNVDAFSGATSSSEALKTAVDRAYGKAEVVEANKAAYFDGIFIGVSADKLVNIMVTIEDGVPVDMFIYYLDKDGKTRTKNQLTLAELAVKKEIESTSNGYNLHKYAYRAAAFGNSDDEKVVSAKVVEAIKSALESAGK